MAVLTSPEMLAKAAAAKAAKNEARRASTLRRDFLDSGTWDDLAARFKVRLPQWGTPPTSTEIRKFLHRIGRSGDWYKQHSGEDDLTMFAKRNPDWPMRALAGICLEWLAQEP